MRTFLRPIAALVTIGVVMIAFAVGLAALPTRAADHLDAPLTSADGRIDINDVYAFQSPANSANTVLIMTVNPAAGVFTNSPTTFHPKASYEFLIDGNGDAKPDTTIEIEFGKVKGRKQEVELELEGPAGEAEAEGKTGQDIEINIDADDNDDNGEDSDDQGGGTLRADLFDDPFFFDLANFNNGATFCGAGLPVKNFFLGLNVSAIVLEVPSTWLGPNMIGVWARTVLDGKQIDRMGRPAINTVFIPNNPFESTGSQEDAFNATKPKNDATWTAEVVNTLTVLFSLNDPPAGLDDPTDDAAAIQVLAGILLPDILTINTADPTGFLNGRAPANDVIDAELGLITEGAITTDCVVHESTFPNTFPYLLPKN